MKHEFSKNSLRVGFELLNNLLISSKLLTKLVISVSWHICKILINMSRIFSLWKCTLLWVIGWKPLHEHLGNSSSLKIASILYFVETSYFFPLFFSRIQVRQFTSASSINFLDVICKSSVGKLITLYSRLKKLFSTGLYSKLSSSSKS